MPAIRETGSLKLGNHLNACRDPADLRNFAQFKDRQLVNPWTALAHP
jgi:hypothetical protein